MNYNNDKSTFWLAKASLYCFLLAIASGIFYGLLVIIGLDLGQFIAVAMFLFILSPLLAFISLIIITIKRKYLKGYTLALLALILSIPPIYVLFSIQLGVRARAEFEKKYSSTYKLKLLGKSMVDYAKYNNGYLPNANNWCDELIKFNQNLTKDSFLHPAHNLERMNFIGDCSYAFNKNLSGLKLDAIPSDVILLFEADGPWNLNGGSELLRKRCEQHYYLEILFADQSTENYWFAEDAVRRFDKSGRRMYYEKPRWKP